MKLFELAHELYDADGNIEAEVVVETVAIAEKYGFDHAGKHYQYAGVKGRMNDIPVWLGGYEVTDYDCGLGKVTFWI